MKKIFLYLNLFAVLFIVGAGPCFAAKKYRYIKREHGARFTGNIMLPGRIPQPILDFQKLNLSFNGAYAYNFKGYFEFGPYLNFSMNSGQMGWKAGLFGEYNFIKNRGKRKWIPSLGLNLGGGHGFGFHLSGGLQASLKAFVAKRTAFISILGFDISSPLDRLFTSLTSQLSLKMGFAYYFDSY